MVNVNTDPIVVIGIPEEDEIIQIGTITYAGPPGERGIQGLPGATGPQGLQGASGLPGAKGEKGDKGDTGNIGPQGLQGPQGVQGNQGATGPQGNTGLKGDTGLQGPQGLKGDKGDQGIPGTAAAKGDPGISAYQVAVQNGFSGSEPTWISSLRGEQGIQGPQGLTGPKGDGFKYRGVWGSQFTYEPNDVVTYQGATYINKSLTSNAPPVEGSTWGTWSAKGDTGPQGAASTVAGPQGPQGIQGLTGPQGPKGDTGADSTVVGPQGIQGPAGPKGDKGDTGAASTVAGPQGIQGPKGDQGIQGPAGTNGTNGADGAQGPRGFTGEQGIPGVGVPTGGTTGQILSKATNANYDTAWVNAPSGGSGGFAIGTGGSLGHPGTIFIPPYVTASTSSASPIKGMCYLYPVDIAAPTLVSEIVIQFVTGSFGYNEFSSRLWLPIYKSYGGGGAPDFTQLVTAPEFTTTVSGNGGIRTLPLNITLQPGRYWYGWLQSANSSSTITVVSIGTTNGATVTSGTGIFYPTTGVAIPLTQSKAFAVQKDVDGFATGFTALPDSNAGLIYTVINASNTYSPLVGLRAG